MNLKKSNSSDARFALTLLVIFAVLVLLLIPAISSAQVNWQVKAGHPAVFDLNQGQFDPIDENEVLFHAKIGKLNFYFTEDGYTARYYEVLDQHEMKEKWEKYEHGESYKSRPLLSYQFKFENSNPEVELVADEKQSFTINYGSREGRPTIVTPAFKSITYKNIYPNIDARFLVSEDGGLKYDLILKKGANPDDIVIHHPQAESITQLGGTELLLKSYGFEFNESIPSSFYEASGNPLDVEYVVTGNHVSFDVPVSEVNETIIIDPWTVTVSPFTAGDSYYKVDWDDAGNVWASGDSFYELAKFDNTGTLQWVYDSGVTGGGFDLGGDFIIRHGTGEAIYTPTWEDDIYKLDPDGTMTDSYLTVTFPQEVWRVEYDEINDQIILGKGGAFGGGYYLGILEADFSSDLSVEVLPSGGSSVEDVVFMELDPDGSKVYSLAAGGAGTAGWNNDVVTCDLPALTSPTNFTTALPFNEAGNGDFGEFVPPFLPNSFNGICVDADYIYTYDGNTVSQYEKSTSTLLAEVSFGLTVKQQSGIDVNPCNGDVYVGKNDSVIVFDNTLTQVGGYEMPGSVIDVRIGNELYVGGEGFLLEIDITTSGAGSEPSLIAAASTCLCDGTAIADTTICGPGLFESIVWGPGGETTLEITGLCPGEYTATITFIDGLDTLTYYDTVTVDLSAGGSIDASVDFTDESCPGANNGTITLAGLTGTPPYLYDIGTETNTTGIFTGLAPGTYDITVTDANGCPFISTVTIGTGGGLNINVVTQNDPTCYGFTDGSITIEVTGGSGDLTYEWDPENTVPPGSTFNNLGAGTYTVTVTDTSGCEGTLAIVLDQPDSMSIDLDLTHVLCNGDATGIATIDTVNNHQGPFSLVSYDWSSGPPGGLGATSAIDLTAGQYTLDLTDSAGCSQSIEFIIEEPPLLEFSEIGYEPAYCRLYGYQVGNGQVYGAATGGTPDYTYQWENLETGELSTNTTWGGLNPGDYEITVTDGNGCILTQVVSLDSVNPTAVLDIFSDDFTGPLEGTAELCITASNHSEWFANPLNPIADTSFWVSLDYPNDPWALYQDDEFYEVFDTCFAEGGQYNVCLKIQNKNGCEDSVCHTVIVNTPLVITAPNVFTPDGDGVNDVFTFEFLAEGVVEFECLIVNRWGVKMNEFYDIAEGWDGTDRSGSESTDGVYFYIYRAVGETGEIFEGQGTVQLLRNK